MSVARLIGVLGVLAACTGGGGGGAPDASDPDASDPDASDSDAAMIDAIEPDATEPDARLVDARLVDARRIDGANSDAAPQPCSGVTPQAITTPRTQRDWAPVPPGGGWAAPFSLATPVPLESLWFDVPYYVMLTVHASCGGPVVATGTYHEEQFDVAFARWTDGTATNLAAGTYVFEQRLPLPDPPFPRLDVRGVIADGAACDDPLVAAGVLACSPRANCTAGVCAVAACSNGLDDDGDGLADDTDPGCALANDVDEADPCGTGGPCPECADAIDSDGDGHAGWPADRGCDRSGDPVEHNCPDADGVLEVTTEGPYSLAGLTSSDQQGTLHCGHSHVDRVLHLQIPGDLGRLSVGVGQQSVHLALYRDTCETEPVACKPAVPGWGSIPLGAVPAGDYWLVAVPVNSNVAVRVTGTLVVDAACDPTRPAFACASGQSCQPDSGGGHRCQ